MPLPSALWYCWLSLLTCKTVSQITHTVLVDTLDPAHSLIRSLLVSCSKLKYEVKGAIIVDAILYVILCHLRQLVIGPLPICSRENIWAQTHHYLHTMALNVKTTKFMTFTVFRRTDKDGGWRFTISLHKRNQYHAYSLFNCSQIAYCCTSESCDLHLYCLSIANFYTPPV